MLEPVILGSVILVFIVQLLIIWYQWWCYNELNNEIIDTQDMVLDIYQLSVADLSIEGKEVTPVIPKRVKQRITRKEAKRAAIEAGNI